MKNVLITGSNSFVGDNVRRYLLAKGDCKVDVVDTVSNDWLKADYSQYDVVYHVAGIAHVNPSPKLKDLYYRVNCDLAVAVAKKAKEAGVKQFIFMSSIIVYSESQTLEDKVITADVVPSPADFYGDSKLQAEIGLKSLETDQFKICILRPPLIYGVNFRGNFPRLMKLASLTPVFPAWHNKRSMCYIDNLAEFVHQAILRELHGVFYPQNREFADTLEIVRFFASECRHRIWISKIFNPLVRLGAKFLRSLNKMFATYYYDPSMSTYEFDYQLVSFKESLKRVSEDFRKTGKKL
jgi:nucleoside-diphosphate-sugar epimerase